MSQVTIREEETQIVEALKLQKKLSRRKKVEFLSSYLNPKVALGLEIGPNISPLFPKREGFNVEYIESMDTEALRERCVKAKQDPSRVEVVDYVFQRDQGLVLKVRG